MNTNKPILKVGLIGSGFMGKCHATAFNAVSSRFELPVNIELELLADIDEASARRSAENFGFVRYTANWKELVSDPTIDIVAITAPNILHEAMALEAIHYKKIVYCEKPLSTSVESAQRMLDAAEKAGTITQVGFGFLRNPLLRVARDMIQNGELGEITSFRGRHAENYMTDPVAPHSFRTDPAGGGALDDIGSHITSMARYLLGPIAEVSARKSTVHKNRPIKAGSTEAAEVLVDDVAHVLLSFQSGVIGSMDVSWVQTGRTMDLSFEISGTQGAIAFNQQQMNELQVCLPHKTGSQSFIKIETGPEHEPYDRFCPAAGHHLGFNDLKVIEVAQLIYAITEGRTLFTDFREGLEVQRSIEAMHESARNGQWVAINR